MSTSKHLSPKSPVAVCELVMMYLGAYYSTSTKFCNEREFIDFPRNVLFRDRANTQLELAKNFDSIVKCQKILSTSEISLSTIMSAHHAIVSDKKLNGFRKKNVQLGRAGLKNHLIPPAFDEVPHLTNEWLTLLQTLSSECRTKVVMQFYCLLLHIHPFLDGNGRLARCFLLKFPSTRLLPVYFQITRGEGHSNLVREVSTSRQSALFEAYVAKYLRWSNFVESRIQTLLLETVQKKVSDDLGIKLAKILCDENSTQLTNINTGSDLKLMRFSQLQEDIFFQLGKILLNSRRI